MNDKPKQVFKGGGTFADYPGWYKLDGGTEDGSGSWSVVRKPEGSPITYGRLPNC